MDWACEGALQRLGFASPKEIAAFYDLVPLPEAKTWVADNLATGRLTPLTYPTAAGDKVVEAVALTEDLPNILAEIPIGNRIRILSPFDPLIRDRVRLEKLFGFAYRIEVFVPAPKRTYGYYVFPILEGTKFIGRIDAKADRPNSTLRIQGFWPEASVKMSQARSDRLRQELGRFAKLAGCESIVSETEALSV